jgi:hypothetical protein
VNRWVGRFALGRLAGLSDRAGRGRKRWLPPAAVQQVVSKQMAPPHLGRWSCRTMARCRGVAGERAALMGGQRHSPHSSRTFKPSNDKRF